jgi:hypothetical protein
VWAMGCGWAVPSKQIQLGAKEKIINTHCKAGK